MIGATRCSFLSVLMILCSPIGRSAELTTLTGEKITGTVTSLSNQGIEFKEGERPIKFSVKETGLIDFRQPVLSLKDFKYIEIELTDGTILRVSEFLIKKKAVEIKTLGGKKGDPATKFTIPLSSVFWIMRDAHNPKTRAEWLAEVSRRGKRDMFVNRDEKGLNSLQGTFMEGSEDGKSIKFMDEKDEVGSVKLFAAKGGLIFNQGVKDVLPPKICSISDVFGNVLVAQSIETNGANIKIRTISDAEVEYPLAMISKIDFSQGNILYLSDLSLVDPIDYPPEENDGTLGKRFPFSLKYQTENASDIVLGGRKYSKGIAVPPDTMLTYKIDGEYRELCWVCLGLEFVKSDTSPIKIRIEIEGREAFYEAFNRKTPPKELTLNVKDAKSVKISTERDGPICGTQINLAEARLQK